jgi:hypothetical protein
MGERVNWFNPSIAHQCLCRSDIVLKTDGRARAQYVPNGIRRLGIVIATPEEIAMTTTIPVGSNGE